MGNLRDTEEGLVLPIKVTPGARKTEIVGWRDGWLKIKVTAPPERGEANLAVVRLLAKTFQLPQNKIILLRGASGRTKEFLLVGYSRLEFERAAGLS